MKETQKNPWAMYCGPRTDCKNAWGTRGVLRGPVGVIAAVTESGTDEDCESAGRVLKTLIDHYMKRPSLADEAIQYILCQCNNVLFAPGGAVRTCDLSAMLLLEEQVRMLVSGSASVFHFEDGKLCHRTENAEYPLLGEKMFYSPKLEPAFRIREADNAFLAASPMLCKQVSQAQMEDALTTSANMEEWIQRLVDLAGSNMQFCAVALSLNELKPNKLFRWIRKKL